MDVQPWWRSDRADPAALPLADRHYSRQQPGTSQFVPPGRCLVLLTGDRTALWVSSWPRAEFVLHAWPGAVVCSLFHREPGCPVLASDLIRAAVAATHAVWSPPPQGMVTFVAPGKVRHKRDPGRCFLRAGWHRVGTTKAGLLAFHLPPQEWPPPALANGSQERLDLAGVS